jgi:predicted DNA-binding transcriptional regulator YafY
MPYNKDAYTRYKLIDVRIRNKQKPKPTLAQLIEYVNDKLGKTVSASSIQKDIEAMRYDKNLAFNAPIAYDRLTKGYYYTEEGYSIEAMPLSEADLQGLEMALGILQQFKSVPAIKYFQEAISDMAASVKKNRISSSKNTATILLDRPNQYLGSEYMAVVVDAINEKNVIKLSYLGFNKLAQKEHTVHPYFIKEYDGRLYLIGNDVAPGKAQKFLTFSFDRITKISATYDSFKEEYVDKANYYKNTLGISNVDAVPEKIILSFNPIQAPWLRTQKIHHSQNILIDNNTEFRIELELVVNHELKTKVLSYGSALTVLQPAHLKEFVLNEINSMKKLYM